MRRQCHAFFFDPFLYVVGDGFDLGCGIPLADYEEISWRIFQAAQVELDDPFAFDVLNAVNDQFVQLFGGELTPLNFNL